jgi:FkbM family methyltransferase
MDIAKYLRYSLLKILSIVDVFPTRTTSRADLIALLESLYPISCDTQLIRFGPDGDGGYLIPNDLEGIEACFSPGVSDESGFEMNCAESGIKVYMADRSVDKPSESHPLFNFSKKFIGVTSNIDFMTINDWVANSQLDTQTDLMLQMDIEGFEYEVILSINDKLLRRFRIIVLEFHQLHMLWSLPFFNITSRVFEKILQTHTCVHIHPNNLSGALKKGGLTIPRLMEFTFLRNDRVINPSFQNTFPHPLDYDNYSRNQYLPLPPCWYKG